MPSLSPKKNREIVLQILYSLDMGIDCKDDLISLLMKELLVTRQQMESAHAQASAVFAEKERLDGKIANVTADYDFERIGRVERNILRLALFETNTLPIEVVVAESYRLAIKFSTESGATFIHAIINALMDKRSTNAPLPSP